MRQIALILSDGARPQVTHLAESRVSYTAEINTDTNYFFWPSVQEMALIEAGAKLEQADIIREEAMLELVKQFQDARAAGMSITTIHQLTGLSRQTLHKISKKLSAAQCSNPECPKAGRCGGECARNF